MCRIALGISPGVGLLDHMEDLCLDFLKASKFLPQWLQQLAFPPAVYQDSFFWTSLPTHIVGDIFYDGYSNRDEVES
jgi:hypothetical protein